MLYSIYYSAFLVVFLAGWSSSNFSSAFFAVGPPFSSRLISKFKFYKVFSARDSSISDSDSKADRSDFSEDFLSA